MQPTAQESRLTDPNSLLNFDKLLLSFSPRANVQKLRQDLNRLGGDLVNKVARHAFFRATRGVFDFDGDMVVSQPLLVLIGQALGGVAIRVAGAGVGFIVGALLAREMGPKGFGLYSVVMASVTLSASAGALGWPALATRDAAAAFAARDWPRLRGMAYASLLSTGLTGAAIAIVICWLFDVGIANYAPLRSASQITLLLGGILVPIMAMSLVRAGILRGLRQVIRGDISDLVIRPGIMLILLLSIGVSEPNATGGSVEAALTYQIAATIIAFVLGLAFLKRALPSSGTAIRPVGWLKSAMPFWLIAQIGLLCHQAPLYLLGSLAPPEELGLFAIAGQFAGIISLCVISIEMPLQGRLAEAWSRNAKAEAERLARGAGRLGLGIAALLGGVLILSADHLLGLIGPDYVSAAPVLRILVIGQIAYALSGPCRIVLSMSGEERIVLWTVVAAFGATVLLASVTIPRLGASGAALAGAGGATLLNGVLLIASWYRLGISTSPLLPPRQ